MFSWSYNETNEAIQEHAVSLSEQHYIAFSGAISDISADLLEEFSGYQRAPASAASLQALAECKLSPKTLG